ncbi:hypothetical protein [Coprobacter tertius]|nr:hypothetical protein [Coprobacter tertius]
MKTTAFLSGNGSEIGLGQETFYFYGHIENSHKGKVCVKWNKKD